MESNKNKQPYQAYEIASLFARYTGAWQEYGQRIAARHQIINIWILGATGLMVFYVDKATKVTKSEFGDGDQSYLIIMVAIALPAFSLAMFALMLVHDIIMQHLSNYMYACELYNNSLPNGEKLPSYRVDSKFSGGFLKIRSIQNIVMILFSLALALGTFLVDQHIPKGCEHSLPVWTHIIITIIWVIAISLNIFGVVYRWDQCRNRTIGKEQSQAR